MLLLAYDVQLVQVKMGPVVGFDFIIYWEILFYWDRNVDKEEGPMLFFNL